MIVGTSLVIKTVVTFLLLMVLKELTRNRILGAILLWWPRYVVVQRIDIPQKQITGGLVRGIKHGIVFIGLCWEKLLAYSLLREKHQFEEVRRKEYDVVSVGQSLVESNTSVEISRQADKHEGNREEYKVWWLDKVTLISRIEVVQSCVS
jgi:hypothetical protein